MTRLRTWFTTHYAALRDDLSSPGGVPLSRATVIPLIATCILLTLFYYYGRSSFYRSTLGPIIEPALDLPQSPLNTLFPHIYWACASVFIRILIPVGLITLTLGDHVRDYGYALWTRGHAKIYVGMYMFMLPLLVWASNQPDFIKKYPFYKQATTSAAHFIIYELAYGAQFAAGEAFFRGFVLFALYKRFGYNAILIMVIPYCMIHFGKPIPETLGSIVAGVVLGYMAIKSKSWLPGALLHWSVGFTMDVLCLWQKSPEG